MHIFIYLSPVLGIFALFPWGNGHMLMEQGKVQEYLGFPAGDCVYAHLDEIRRALEIFSENLF